MMFRAHMVSQVFVALAWKLNMVLSLKILNANPATCTFPPYLRVIAVSLLMVLVVKGSRVAMSLIYQKYIIQHLKENFVKCFDYEMSLHGNYGHRREHHSQTGSRAHDGNAPCGDIHDPGDKGRGDGRDNHDHPRRVQQASRREPTQH